MSKIKKAAIVCCSNGQDKKHEEKLKELAKTLTNLGIEIVFSPYIYGDENGSSASGAKRAESLMGFYKDESVDAVFDISGGDLANEILHLLDYEEIQKYDKLFWGYSDLTAVINAIYAKTGKPSVLYQVRNLLYQDKEQQIKNFNDAVKNYSRELYEFECSFIQGKEMSGIVVGGNIRCLLKLAGTPYWPDMQNKILLLESFSGTASRMTAYLSQLKQMGIFEQVRGVLLGTFTEMEKNGYSPKIEEMILQYIGKDLPVAKTKEIGHGTDSKAIGIGMELQLKK